jgi:hypothetical protein
MIPPNQKPPARGTLLAAASLLVVCLGLSGAAEAKPRTLYEKLAYGRLIIVGTCLQQGWRATIQVDEVLKGDLAAQRIQIAFRLQNFERSPGDQEIEFLLGERAILVLEPDPVEGGDEKDVAVYLLSRGPEGKIDIPAEGSAALLGAVRRMVRIQSLGDQNEIWEEQRQLLREVNPLLVETGFQEVLKFRLGNEGLLPLLSRYLFHPRDSFRLDSLRVLAQIFDASRRRGERLSESGTLIVEVLTIARGDTSPEVRAQAIRVLSVSGREDLREFMQEVARSDPSQLVRFEAQRSLLELEGQAPAPAGDLSER